MDKTIQKRVKDILSEFEETRDSDIKLFAKYMNTFYNAGITIEQVNRMLKGPSYASIIRERSFIQNKLCQYQPSKQVKQTRHQKQSEYRDRYSVMYKYDVL